MVHGVTQILKRRSVPLNAELDQRVCRLAKARGKSIAATLQELVASALESEPDEGALGTSPVTGLPQVRVGRPVTSQLVVELIAG
jgi:hypothetical protein